jgi:hypothetical protein
MSNTLRAGQQLLVNQSLVSGDGMFKLILQADGNLVLYQHGNQPRWNSQTNGRAVSRAIMQTDGNFVIYSPSNKAIWHTNTVGHPGAYLILQNDGNLVIYWQPPRPSTTALWNTGPI